MYQFLLSSILIIVSITAVSFSSDISCKINPHYPVDGILPAGWSKPNPCPPEVIVASDVSNDTKLDIENTLREVSKEWGNYGPLEYWVLGTNKSAGKELIENYCKRRESRSDWKYNSCMQREMKSQGHSMIEYQKIGAESLKRERPSGSAGHNGGFQWGIHRFTSSIPLGMEGLLGVSGDEEQKTIMHEYFHAVQLSQIRTMNHNIRNKLLGPIWFQEGAAEYMAQSTHHLLSSQNRLKKWNNGKHKFNFHKSMLKKLERVKKKKNCVDKMPNASYSDSCREFFYDGGAWAIALLLHNSSQDALIQTFYPNLEKLGWEGSFINTFGKSSKEFYLEFKDFINQGSGSFSNINSKKSLKILPNYN